ncbi:MAG TPA: beta-CASP ribonuclease aCPSF1 [archaeon]|nr:beta-CASP ribonuclease aCPSF1 [archaeon]
MPAYLDELEKLVKTVIPQQAEIASVEMEGPEVVIYTRNPRLFYENDKLVGELAGRLKKKVKIRTDSTLLKPQAEAEKIIRSIVPEEAKITDVKFLDSFNIVNIEAVKLGLVIGKGGGTLKQIMQDTGWTPELLRAPLKPSPVLQGIRHHLWKSAAERKRILKHVAEKIHQEPKKKNWFKLNCLGAFREVGRSAMLLETANSKILMDCGVNVARSEPDETFPRFDTLDFPITEIDAIIISHAHMDHAGFLPYLYAMGCKAPVYCTEPTRDLMALLQLDYIEVLAREGKTPPYSERDIRQTIKYCIPRKYEEVTDITCDLRMTLYDAGHILGSSSAHIHEGNGQFNLVYTGDIKYGFTRLFNPAQNNFPRVEGVIIESTYGGGLDDNMPSRKECEQKLLTIINRTIERNGSVLIPSFGVGRGEEIMLVIEQLYNEGRLGKKAQVWIDGMVKQAAAIHTAYPDYLKANIRKRTLRNDSPFISEIFKSMEDVKDRDEIIKAGGSVIIAPSGMLTGGPSLEYFKKMAEDEKNAIVFVGWQGEGALGRRVQNGLKELQTTDSQGKIKSLKINMHVDSIHGFSGHSDRRELISYLSRLSQNGLKRVFVNHGEEKNAHNFAGLISKMLKVEAYAPRVMDTLRLA